MVERAYSVPLSVRLSASGVSNLRFKFFRQGHPCPVDTFLVVYIKAFKRIFFIFLRLTEALLHSMQKILQKKGLLSIYIKLLNMCNKFCKGNNIVIFLTRLVSLI